MWNEFTGWLSAPFDIENMSPIQWALLTVLIVTVMVMWRQFILRHIVADY